MKADNPAALRFILQDDIYLLNNDKIAEDKILTEPAAQIVSEPIVETPAAKLNYLGTHKKRFLILVHYPNHEFIADDHLAALENILKRKTYEVDDVAILNMATATVTAYNELLTYFTPEKLLILGKNALPLKMEPITLNQPKQLTNVVALFSFSFDDMMSDTNNKKAFWEQMKTL